MLDLIESIVKKLYCLKNGHLKPRNFFWDEEWGGNRCPRCGTEVGTWRDTIKEMREQK